MKVPLDEEVANHISAKSCSCDSNITAETLTGESAGMFHDY